MKNKIFIMNIIFIIFFFFATENTFAARCHTASTTGFPCTSIDSAGSACSMTIDAGCWPDQSTVANLSVCVVKQTTYTDTKYTVGANSTCNSFRECKENASGIRVAVYVGEMEEIWVIFQWT